MKTKYPLSAVLFILISGIIITSCKKDKPATPEIVTTAIKDISYTTATGGGIVSDDGGASIVSRGICWNTSEKPTVSDNLTNEPGELGAFSSSITNLTPNTIYFVRAYAINSAGTRYGDQITFTTTQALVPLLTTTVMGSIAQTTAVSGGNITSDNGASIIARGVCWSTSANPTIESDKTEDGTGIGSFTSNLKDLLVGTIYHVRAYAVNNVGTAYGNDISFTTSGATLSVITTTSISSVTLTTAVSGGNITADGGGAIKIRGICWANSVNPTINDNKTIDDSGTGSFTSNLSGLPSGTTIYVRAYATNSAGTSYGNQLSFNTKVADVDGNSYGVIKIGPQLWMAENLKTTRYRNSDLIGTTNPSTKDISTESLAKYQWPYNADENNISTYGRLYTWYAATDNRGVCPVGWHLPTDTEWTAMSDFLGGLMIAGGKLKEVATTHWSNPNTGATNEVGFTGLPGGYRNPSGLFNDLGNFSVWWTLTELDTGNSWYRFITNYAINESRETYPKSGGFSLRCIKD